MQQHAGQYLADLVVEVAGDADALRLLCSQDAPTALPPLALESVEHSIERDHDATDLVAAEDLQPLAGAEQVDRFHPLRQTFERRERPPQQQGVRGQRNYQ